MQYTPSQEKVKSSELEKGEAVVNGIKCTNEVEEPIVENLV